MRYDKIEHLLRLALRMAGTQEGVSLQDIMTEFEVARRTAERMRDAIERTFPQMTRVANGERTHRWRLPAQSLRGLIDVNAEELAELDACARRLRTEGAPPDRAAILDRLSGKLRAAMRPEAIVRAEADLELLMQAEGSAMRPGPRPMLAPGLLVALRTAILGCSAIRFTYRSAAAQRARSHVAHPLGLLHGPRPYLVASLPGTPGDPTLFRLDRLSVLQLCGTSFTRDPNFDLAAYASRSFGVFQDASIAVCLRFSAAAAAEARRFHFHPTQTLEDTADGGLLVRFQAGGQEEMIRHILTWRSEVTVVAPAELRASLLAFLRESARHHRSVARRPECRTR